MTRDIYRLYNKPHQTDEISQRASPERVDNPIPTIACWFVRNPFQTKQQAIQRENQLKSAKGRHYIWEMIRENGF